MLVKGTPGVLYSSLLQHSFVLHEIAYHLPKVEHSHNLHSQTHPVSAYYLSLLKYTPHGSPLHFLQLTLTVLKMDIPYPRLRGELWDVYNEYCRENLPGVNETL